MIREHPPSTIRNVDGGPLGGAGAEDPGASTINAKKRRQRATGTCRSLKSGSTHHRRYKTTTAGPRVVPKLKIREHPPSTLRNVDDTPPGGAGAGDPGAPTINAKKRRRWARGRCQS
jgi:hypothetical protein